MPDRLSWHLVSPQPVELDEIDLRGSDFKNVHDRIHWALRHAHRALDAPVGINGNEVRSFNEAVHRANFHTVCVFALNAWLGDDESHDEYASAAQASDDKSKHAELRQHWNHLPQHVQ